MTAQGFCLFESALGTCGIAWGEQGIVCSQLPEAGAAATRARLVRLLPGVPESEPPSSVRAAIAGIVALLRAEPCDLEAIALDMRGVSEFRRKVYVAARRIPVAQTLSYGELARQLGDPGAARAVGQALGHNPFAPIVPCHRILAAGGRTGGFSAQGGVTTKLRMLAIERRALGAAAEEQLELI
jgi:methylated-DNA-[protein]-cysteine S-methyltransferase